MATSTVSAFAKIGVIQILVAPNQRGKSARPSTGSCPQPTSSDSDDTGESIRAAIESVNEDDDYA